MRRPAAPLKECTVSVRREEGEEGEGRGRREKRKGRREARPGILKRQSTISGPSCEQTG